MKKIIPLFFTLSMLFLGSSCIDEVIKFVKTTDTIYVEGKPITNFVQTTHVDTVYRDLVRVDTVEVTVVVHDTVVLVNNVETVRVDTVVQIKTDSIFIEKIVEKIVNHYDTIIVERIITNVDTTYIDRVVTIHDTIYVTEYEQRVIYEALFYVFPGQSSFYIPDELKPYYDSFLQDAAARGVSLPGGDIVAQWVPLSDIPGEQWVSSSYQVSGFQWVINIWEGLPVEESKAAMYRELARIQLAKKYSNDVNKVMSPLFRTSPDPTVSEINTLFQ